MLEGLLALLVAIGLGRRSSWTLWTFAGWWAALIARLVASNVEWGWRVVFFGWDRGGTSLTPMRLIYEYLVTLPRRGLTGSAPMLVLLLIAGFALLRKLPAIPRSNAVPGLPRRWAYLGAAVAVMFLLVVLLGGPRPAQLILIACCVSVLIIGPVVVITRGPGSEAPSPVRLWSSALAISAGWLFAGRVLMGPPLVSGSWFGWSVLLCASSVGYWIALDQAGATWNGGSMFQRVATATAALICLGVVGLCLLWGFTSI